MAYQALYRKFRPTNFAEVFGQEPIVRTLRNAVKYNKLTHAYIFSGPRGTGKTSVAKILAKTINCLNPENGEPCNKCDNCLSINTNTSSDIIEIDAASNNGVDEIREIRNKINLVPAMLKYKVYIVDEVHMLSSGAFNALLKTLEEPPAHIVFILATTEFHKIPSTIISRCQRFDFQKISPLSIKEGLNKIVTEENIVIEEAALNKIADLCDGGMRDAISMLDQLISYADDKIVLQDVYELNGLIGNEAVSNIAKLMTTRNLSELLEKLNYYNDKGKNLVKFTEELIVFLKNVLIYLKVPTYYKNETEVSAYQPFKQVPERQIYECIKELNSCLSDMKISNNPELLLEIAFIKLTNTNVKPAEGRPISQATVNTIEDLIKVRVENTLSRLDKQQIETINKQWDDLKSLTIDNTMSKYAILLLDGILKAASKENLIIVYDELTLATEFNKNVTKMEYVFNTKFSSNYKMIAVTVEEWEKIKEKFNSKKHTFTYREENIENFDLLSELEEVI